MLCMHAQIWTVCQVCKYLLVSWMQVGGQMKVDWLARRLVRAWRWSRRGRGQLTGFLFSKQARLYRSGCCSMLLLTST